MPTFLNATEAFPKLLQAVLNGEVTESRNGKTKELMMEQITLRQPFPAEITTPGRKVALHAQIAETMWLLAGRNDIEWLSHYLPRAKDFSDDGETWRGGYGPRIRHWDKDRFNDRLDQLQYVIDLLKKDPGTRRAVISIYDPNIDTAPGKDIPCNDFLHFIARDGTLHLNVFTRSNDLMWGWSGINSFEWAILLQIVAGLTGMGMGSVTFNISSLHIYEQHWGRAERLLEENKFRAGRPTWSRPNQVFDPEVADYSLEGLDKLVEHWFSVEKCLRDPEINFDVNERLVDEFPEPMMRSWLRVLLAWNTGNDQALLPLRGTSLHYAAAHSPKRKLPTPALVAEGFTRFTGELHAEKHAAYGHSWCKRGEMLGIMANIARKVDRLGVAGGGDTSADTAIDLLVYLVKYRLWLFQNGKVKDGTEHALEVGRELEQLGETDRLPEYASETLIKDIKLEFDRLEPLVADKRADRTDRVDYLITLAHPLALRLWHEELSDAKKEEGIIPQRIVTGVMLPTDPPQEAPADWTKVQPGHIFVDGTVKPAKGGPVTSLVVDGQVQWNQGTPPNPFAHGLESKGTTALNSDSNATRRFNGYAQED